MAAPDTDAANDAAKARMPTKLNNMAADQKTLVGVLTVK